MSHDTQNNPWIARRPNSQAQLRLFCFPYAGGGSAAFRLWARHLPDYIEICPIIYPGRELRLREKPFTDLTAMVAACASALLPLMDRPFAFFGYSLGAMVSFELTRYLRRHKLALPVQLMLAAFAAPAPVPMARAYHKLPDDAFIERLRRLNGTPEEVLQNPELMEILLPLMRADFTAFETYLYTPEAPLDMPLVIFGGLGDKTVQHQSLLDWRHHTRGEFSLHMLPGDHFFLQPSHSQLLTLLAQHLNNIVQARS